MRLSRGIATKNDPIERRTLAWSVYNDLVNSSIQGRAVRRNKVVEGIEG